MAAAVSSSRMSVLGENAYGDQDKDANSLLLELDKGLRSGKVGEQCEAIVRFPQLFEKYPFPILINSSFLKVADVFRVGSNFLRLCVLRVTQQSEKHLEKITSVDEFLRRIFAVIHSNDPVARALTLRTLGSVSCIIMERKNVHHSIISSLDSHDNVELEAAIFAASLFAARSKCFASSICSKLAEMVECTSVPLDIKLKLISIFEHMHFDPENYQRVRQLCTHMLVGYPSCKFVLPLLRTLTHLAACSLVDIPVQVSLLLQYFNEDVRRVVRLAVLRDLHHLAVRAPHMWTISDIMCLCDALKPGLPDDLQLGIVKVLSALSQTVVLANLSPEASSRLLSCCMACCYHDNVSVVAAATEMLLGIVAEKQKDGIIPATVLPLLENACSTLETALMVVVDSGSHQDCQKVIMSMVQLCKLHTSVTDRIVDAIASCLGQVSASLGQTADNNIYAKRAVSLCDGLSAISDLHSGVLHCLVPDFVSTLGGLLCTRHLASKDISNVLLALIRLMLQGCADDGLPVDVVEVINAVRQDMDDWMAYKIGRQAARFSHHALAAIIFSRLMVAVSTENYHFWLTALKECCTGESCLQGPTPMTLSQFVDQALKAEMHYHTGVVALKAAATPTHPLTFQIEYAQLRACMLPAFARVVQACCSFQTSPPPAIAASLAMTTGLEKHRCEHVLVQLRKCCQTFSDLDQKYRSLVQSSFDADSSTLLNITRLQQICRLMVHVITCILSCTENDGKSPTATASSVEEMPCSESSAWNVTKNHVLELLHNTTKFPPGTPLTDKHMECIQQSAVLLTRVRHCLPRYMFQRLQTTAIKLALSPTPRNADEPIVVHYDTRLTLKVEGVIQVGSQARFHDVHSVELTVDSIQQSRAATLGDNVKIQENPSNHMVQSAVPHNDYFSVQFLLAFPVTGLHQVTIEASVVDTAGTRWSTGPRSSFLVKSYDEAMHRHQQLQYANQPRHGQIPPPPSRSVQLAGSKPNIS